MTSPDEPRDRSWDDGTANPPPDRPDSDPSTQAWQPYPDSGPLPDPHPYQPYPDQPTQQYPASPHPGDQQHPGNQYPGQYYPDRPTAQYPTQQYGNQGQPYSAPPQYGSPAQPNQTQPNPTQVFPAYDPNHQTYAPQQHGAPQNYGATQNYGASQNYVQPPNNGEQPYSSDPGSGGNSSRKWIVALVALAALAVIVLAGILVVTNQDSAPTTALRPPATSLAPRPTVPPTQAPLTPTTPGGLVPGGIPEILGGAGAAIGTITAIDGSTLSIQGIDGAPVTVSITPQTQVLSLSGLDASSLKVGSLVVVNGSPMQDGSITADVIVETPDLGG